MDWIDKSPWGCREVSGQQSEKRQMQGEDGQEGNTFCVGRLQGRENSQALLGFWYHSGLCWREQWGIHWRRGVLVSRGEESRVCQKWREEEGALGSNTKFGLET